MTRPHDDTPALDTTFHDIEMDVGDGPWERWYDDAVRLLGHDLDGDQERDGYSIDFAYDQFRAGVTTIAYAKSVRHKRA